LFRSPCFQLNCCFRGQRATVISQLTERFLPCRFRLPLAFITKDQRRQKNGKKRLGFDYFSVLLLTIFSFKLLFSWPTRDRDIAAHRPNFALLPSPPACLHCNRAGTAKRMVRNRSVFTIAQLFHSPFFQLNYCFGDTRAL
jgi:hypothetical protein